MIDTLEWMEQWLQEARAQMRDYVDLTPVVHAGWSLDQPQPGIFM